MQGLDYPFDRHKSCTMGHKRSNHLPAARKCYALPCWQQGIFGAAPFAPDLRRRREGPARAALASCRPQSPCMPEFASGGRRLRDQHMPLAIAPSAATPLCRTKESRVARSLVFGICRVDATSTQKWSTGQRKSTRKCHFDLEMAKKEGGSRPFRGRSGIYRPLARNREQGTAATPPDSYRTP